MPRDITVTFDDGSTHVYKNAPDDVTPDQVSQRAQSDFGKQVKALDGGRKTQPKRAEPTPKPVSTGIPSGKMDALIGVPEAGMNMVSGMVAKPVGEVAGLAAMARDLITGNKEGDPQGFERYVQNQLTYQPRSRTGQAIAKWNPLALAGRAVDFVGNTAGNVIAGAPEAQRDNLSLRGMLGNAAHEAINQAPGILGAKYGEEYQTRLPSRRTDASILEGQSKALDAIRAKSQEAGLITPVEGASWLEGVPGISKVNKWLSSPNQTRAPELAAQDLGLPKGVALTPEELDMVRSRYGSTSRAIAAEGDKMEQTVRGDRTYLFDPGTKVVKGFAVPASIRSKFNSDISEISSLKSELPETFKSDETSLRLLSEYADKEAITGTATLKAIRKLRRDATAEFKSDDPAKIANAFTRKEIADSLEDVIEANIKDPRTLQKFREEREMTAKTYDIESALRPDGTLDLRKLYAISQKRPLSGNLKLLADFAGTYPEAVQRVTGKPVINFWDYTIAAGSIVSGHPAIAAADFAARAGVPYLAQKGLFQKRTPNYNVPDLSPLITGVGIGTSGEAGQK